MRACTEHRQTKLVRPGAHFITPGDGIISALCARSASKRIIPTTGHSLFTLLVIT